MLSFEQLNLIEPILEAVKAEGYTNPTPIQEQSIPVLLEGKDLLGCAQTGTGKTAAFAIPILQLLYNKKSSHNGIKSLILTPTRELAIQIDESFGAYGKKTGLSHSVIFGGVSQVPQVSMLRRGVDILIATPGRLLDLMQQGYIKLNQLEIFVLDEADRMLDMGFIHDVKKVIAKLPAKRQTLFFSATMPPEIGQLANSILNNPVKVEITPVFVQAVAMAIQDYPMINVSVDGSNIVVHQDINIGMATALPSGNLIVPVVKNANQKELVALATDVNFLADAARNNQLKPEHIQGSTFTISNVGTFGSLMGTPIINQPEVAILAFGLIKKRAEVLSTPQGDEIAIRSMMYLSLSFDHRVVDGFLGGSFLRKVGDYLEQFSTQQSI